MEEKGSGLVEGSERRTAAKGVRFRLAVQTSRIAAYTLGCGVGVLSRAIGVLDIRYVDGLVVFAIGVSSALVVYRVNQRGIGGKAQRALDAAWMALDVAIMTWGVYLSGGIRSPFYIWYLAAASSVAFVAGARATLAVSVGNVVCYVGVLVAMGDIRGLDANLALALTRMAFLHGAAFFFLRGVSDLQAKREKIELLKDAESRKVEELTRLTAALNTSTRELGRASAKIREADRLKSQFLANVSHELRTPLNSIIGFSEILQTRLAEQLEPRYLKFLQNINASGQHLLGIINDILDLAKIESGKTELHPESLSVRSVVDGVCHVMKGVAAKSRIAIEADVPEDLPPLEGDPVKLKQILYNLLSNAVKFSPEDATVTIAAERVAGDSCALGVEAIRVHVTDRGIGIAPEDQLLIFQEFRQADGTSSRRYEGTGLGLSLVKALVGLHGGGVEVKSELGVGSTFTVTLPRAFRGPASASEPELPTIVDLPGGRDERHRVLVVEDELTAFETLAAALAGTSFVPIRARSGEEAILLAESIRPFAITLDLVLPGIDGWATLRLLKENPRTRDIPVIIVSVLESRELGMALGAADYLLKPVDREQLVERLRELLPSGPPEATAILVIDDDPAIHLLLESFLVPLGYATLHATSGREGIELAQKESPGLVILDLTMDGMDGFQVAAELSSRTETSAIPILVLTGREMSQEDRARLAGKIAGLVTKGDPAATRARLGGVLDGLVRRSREGSPSE